MNELLKIQELCAGYGELSILKKVNLSLQKGTVSVLMGPNGAGKSTLLKSLYSMTDIDSGKIFFEGKDITAAPAHELLALGVAFVSQGRINFQQLSVRDNLLLGAHHLKNKVEVASRLAAIYKQFPVLEEKEKQYAATLSGGQQQMLAIARALMSQPKLLLMDEPTLGLAPKIVKEVFQTILDIRKNFDTTILIVEHNLKSLMDLADYGYVLVQGEIIAADACSVLKNSEVMKKVFVGNFD